MVSYTSDSTWSRRYLEPELVEKAARVAAQESSSAGVRGHFLRCRHSATRVGTYSEAQAKILLERDGTRFRSRLQGEHLDSPDSIVACQNTTSDTEQRKPAVITTRRNFRTLCVILSSTISGRGEPEPAVMSAFNLERSSGIGESIYLEADLRKEWIQGL